MMGPEEIELTLEAVEELEETAAMTQASIGVLLDPKIVVAAMELALPYMLNLLEWRKAGRVGLPPAPDAMTRTMKSSPMRGDWGWENLYPGHAYDEWCRHCAPSGPDQNKYPFGRPANLSGRH